MAHPRRKITFAFLQDLYTDWVGGSHRHADLDFSSFE
jgi:hypothetical protein